MSKSRASKQKGYKSLLTQQRNDIYKVPSGKEVGGRWYHEKYFKVPRK